MLLLELLSTVDKFSYTVNWVRWQTWTTSWSSTSCENGELQDEAINVDQYKLKLSLQTNYLHQPIYPIVHQKNKESLVAIFLITSIWK